MNALRASVPNGNKSTQSFWAASRWFSEPLYIRVNLYRSKSIPEQGYRRPTTRLLCVSDFWDTMHFIGGHALIGLLYCPARPRLEISCVFQCVRFSER